MINPLADFSRLCLHTITTKPWSIEEAIQQYAKAGVSGISIWRESVAERDLNTVRRSVEEAGLTTVSYVRGGFFPALETHQRQQAIDENKRILDEAAALGAPLVVLVCGADPLQPLSDSRQQIEEAIAELVPHAKENGVRMGIEPLHPMYADTRSAVLTLNEANSMAERIESEYVGIVLDVYHCWWDSQLQGEITRAGINKNLFAFHVCDWKVHPSDFLNDRGLMGEGCIDIRQIRSWVESAGFNGFIEVEIFSDQYWKGDQELFLKKIQYAYLQHT